MHCDISNPAGTTIPARAETASAPGPHGGAGTGADGRSAALGVEDRQLALYILAAALVASNRLIGLVERAQDFMFFLAVEANIFIDRHGSP
jgi:hypothetical protein